MSPNHHFARDEYGVLGVYYNGTSPLFQFDDFMIAFIKLTT